jgi:hypothetical protein
LRVPFSGIRDGESPGSRIVAVRLAFPPDGQWPWFWGRLPGYSGATAPDSHRLPRTIALTTTDYPLARPASNGWYEGSRDRSESRYGPAPYHPPGMTITRLTFVRDAPTSATRRAAFPLDESLDEGALRAARRLAPLGGQIDAAWCGPAASARETAQELGTTPTIA